MKYALFMALALATSCGDSNVDHVTFTCAISSCVVIECDAYDTAASNMATAQAACEAKGGIVDNGPCATAGSLGTCVVKSQGNVVTVHMFPSNTLVTPDDALLSCETLGGTFTSLGIDLGVAPDTMSCASATECFEFHAITTTVQIEEADNICESVGLQSPTAGACSRTNVQAYCGADRSQVGEYLGIYYDDTGEDEAECVQTLEGEYESTSCP